MNKTDTSNSCNVISFEDKRFGRFDRLGAFVVELFNRKDGDGEFRCELFCLINLIKFETELVMKRVIFLSRADKDALREKLNMIIAQLY